MTGFKLTAVAFALSTFAIGATAADMSTPSNTMKKHTMEMAKDKNDMGMMKDNHGMDMKKEKNDRGTMKDEHGMDMKKDMGMAKDKHGVM